ncbi:hypothetical protein [Ornithinibacillus halophilus]|uniref:Uncharacterized protein n=1 Tax=Ornithinibacillus halophilus TaxID=930117 RepID=A0A1M5GDV8_9BACI|nr:hypothetical protein [Ornithinibacillus halophilus]SHG01869.1 hypothetical protein SAMN05216225_101266 [Ornithinibacillus halophilus]
MGLFINSGLHPDVYQNNSDIEEPNQDYFQTDYFKDLLAEQKKLNETLTKNVKNINKRHQQYELSQLEKWRSVSEQLDFIKEGQNHHEKFEREAREWLIMLEERNKELHQLLEQEGDSKQEILEEIQKISQTNEEIASKLTQYESFSEQLTEQMNQLVELHHGISNQMKKQEGKQDEVISSVENQEALMEKTLRQVDFVRSVLFERTSFLADKIENSYNLTSSMIYKLVTGTEKPLTLLMSNTKKNEANE